MNKIVVFGTGKIYEYKKELLKKNNIVAFLDNDEVKQGTYIAEIPIICPSDVNKLEYDLIFIMSTYIHEMKSQLLNLNVSKDKIFTHNDLYKFDSQLYLIQDALENICCRDKILPIFIPTIAPAGGIIVLVYLAEILKKIGYYPVLISPDDHNYRDKIQQKLLLTIINIDGEFDEIINKIVFYSPFVIVNTLQNFNYVKKYHDTKRVYWWIHEALTFYKEEEIAFLKTKLHSNVKILAVSSYAKKLFDRYSNNKKIEIMHFGIPDKVCNNIQKENCKITIGMVGVICERKGQDILLKASMNLSEKDYNKIDVKIIGEFNNAEYKGIIDSYLSDNVKLFGFISPGNIEQIYNELDVLICCSRDEPMPTVIVEGLMFGKICIVSSNIGMADYIEDGVNGFKYDDPEDFLALSNKISWVINNHDKLNEIRKNARKTYEKHFTMEVFKSRVKEVFEIDKINEFEV